MFIDDYNTNESYFKDAKIPKPINKNQPKTKKVP